MEEKIALLCDSMCDLPPEIASRFGIKVVAARVIYPDKEYSDRVDIQPGEVYERMPEEIPTTSMPPLQEFQDAFESFRKDGYTHVLAIHISSGLSGTSQVAEIAAKNFNDMVIKVIDSRTLSMGTGWMVLDAAHNIANGWSFERIVENLKNLQSKINVYYVIETLEYLRRGGRIGLVASMLGEFLNLKPIISVNPEGKYFTFCKAKGRRKSLEKIMQIVEESIQDKVINLAVVHGGALKECEAIMERVRKLPNIKELIATDISPVLGVHTGPGLVGICVQEA
ncbi:MAG: DegV family protein [Syntrophomonadaceae bacterium]|nr:DegV family protein [Syntrophomonadaceae bacterium]MDD3022529.1 DegV family protein [Syntrophomonadaceae bacterium]